jgi:hypothetical protein
MTYSALRAPKSPVISNFVKRAFHHEASYIFRDTHANMPSPMEQFLCVPELMIELAKHVQNRRLIHSCCLVNKAFNAAFTPVLYSEIWFRPENAHFLIDFPVFANNTALRYAETLDIFIIMQQGQDTKYTNGVLSELYNSGVGSLLAKMPRLTSFRLVSIKLKQLGCRY